MNAPALAKKLSAHVRRMFKGADVRVGQPFKAKKLAIFKDSPDSWNFEIVRPHPRGHHTTFVRVRQLTPGSSAGLDISVDGPDADLVREILATPS